MRLVVEGEPKEIAALIFAVSERREEKILRKMVKGLGESLEKNRLPYADDSDRQQLAQKVSDMLSREFSRFCDPMSGLRGQSLNDT